MTVLSTACNDFYLLTKTLRAAEGGTQSKLCTAERFAEQLTDCSKAELSRHQVSENEDV